MNTYFSLKSAAFRDLKSSNIIVPLLDIFALSLPRSLQNFQTSAATAILTKLVANRYKRRYIAPAMYMPGHNAGL